MIGYGQAVVLGLLQGVSELFPVSSLGHSVILPKLLGWNLNQADPTFLAFVVLLHVGTATALLIYFRRDWLAIVPSAEPAKPPSPIHVMLNWSTLLQH